MLSLHDDKNVIFIVFYLPLCLLWLKILYVSEGFADHRKYKAALVKLPVFYCNLIKLLRVAAAVVPPVEFGFNA